MHETDPNGGASRREFLRGGARYALLSALGAVSATLIQRRGPTIAGQNCISQGMCRGCGAFEECGLPAALSVKEFLSRRRRQEAIQAASRKSQSRLPPEPDSPGGAA